MDKTALLDKLDKATDRSVRLAISRGLPLQLSKNSTLIGCVYVQKNTKGLYDIITTNSQVLYVDISVFDVAIIIAQRYNSCEYAIIHTVLKLEEHFSKHHTDMMHYLNCLKGAKNVMILLGWQFWKTNFRWRNNLPKMQEIGYLFSKK